MHATQCVQLFALENVPEVTCPFVCCERNPFLAGSWRKYSSIKYVFQS